jgi:membrane associated rhomboid family serine protease
MAALLIFAAIVAISLVGFAWRALLAYSLFRPYWFLPKRQYWTLISSGFVHANLTHLLFNVLSYWFFAFPLQRAIGEGRFVALYFIGLILSNTGTWLKHRRDPAYATLGASGAVTAVLFAEIVYYPRSSISLLILPIPIPAPLFAVLYLGFTYYSARQARGPINHDAHLDGALAGLGFVALTDPGAWVQAWHLLIG